ncbi:hypothetical protein PSTG_06604 [Puccinia striiformis f. sp. tritici PST-78]|uniref:Uncharacterized protein n=1 Tax=Puccinia striiformis f. sp. tritici PST-78 TaxID=1165861 RepID=A0A0L0VLP1_9BASI|nr:hypothetical protein PSTG_06604 [Puccinia striiformis f. sp. tritici PST-78]
MNRYEHHIRSLEEIVGLLLARQEPSLSQLFSSAPLIGSFQYSKDCGLIPSLYKTTAEALETDCRDAKLGQTFPSTRASGHSASLHRSFPIRFGHRSPSLTTAEAPDIKNPNNNILEPPYAPTIVSCCSCFLPAYKLRQSTSKAPSRTSSRSHPNRHPQSPCSSSDLGFSSPRRPTTKRGRSQSPQRTTFKQSSYTPERTRQTSLSLDRSTLTSSQCGCFNTPSLDFKLYHLSPNFIRAFRNVREMTLGVLPDPPKLGGTSWDPACELEKLWLVGEAFRRAVATSARRKASPTSCSFSSLLVKPSDEL